MKIVSDQFREIGAREMADPQSQAFLGLLTTVLGSMREMGMATYTDPEGASRYGAAIRADSVARMPALLEQLEENLTANGTRVIWARDAAEANAAILKIAQDNNIRYVTKGKSMITDEMGTNEVLQDHGIDVFEADLGELIVQLLDRWPFHIVGPAINIPPETIRDIFIEKDIMVDPTVEPAELGHAARLFLRDKFQHLEMGITGVNMAVADTGTIINVENEGNIRFSKSSPRIQVSVMSLEKVVPTMEDALYMLRLLCRNCTGQKMGTYITFDTGPKKRDEIDGPEELIVVIVDNGRSKHWLNPELREAFQCIRCGACLNRCPVYGKVGGYAYGWAYSGPIGNVLNPMLLGMDRTKDLFRATTDCGRCKEVCPSGVNHPRIFKYYRQQEVEGNPDLHAVKRPWNERQFFKLWQRAVRSRRNWEQTMRLVKPLINRGISSPGLRKMARPLNSWMQSRNLPDLAGKSFHDRWQELKKETQT